MVMKAVFVACLLVLAGLSVASAADADRHRPHARADRAMVWPSAPDSLSATVLASDGCWRACEAQCGRHVRKCAGAIGLSGCLPFNDACGRTCVKQCRTYGGPLLNWID